MSVDLPLLSNIHDIRARHYIIKLETNVVNKKIDGTVFIFFTSLSKCELSGKFCKKMCACMKANSSITIEKTFPIIIESNDIIINSISQVETDKKEINNFISSNKSKTDFDLWDLKNINKLNYSKDEWCIKIDKNRLFQDKDFPAVICINYSTTSYGKSLQWRQYFDGEPCFFTCGSFINNRSLIPCQDRPLAMATWQSWVIVPKDYYVSMTGDESPSFLDIENSNKSQNSKCFYYSTTIVLPIATISIAVGKWQVENVISEIESLKDHNYELNFPNILKEKTDFKCDHIAYPCHMQNASDAALVPVTIVTISSMMAKAKWLMKFIKFILLSAYNCLGKHPIKRLEFVIMPRSFPNLGLASPNVIFISNSIIIDDSSFYVQLAHEISHCWFGVTIGAKNWEEEWLSEGFATYLEDYIYAVACQLQSMEENDLKKEKFSSILNSYEDFFRLKALIKYKTLLSEIENSDEELQILCPIEKESSSLNSVKNGLNADKSFLQVHYLKGYFLLCYLANLVPKGHFQSFLKIYSAKFHGQLITSGEFLDFFYELFPSVGEVAPKMEIITSWLRNKNVNPEIEKLCSSNLPKSTISECIKAHTTFWSEYKTNSKSKCPKLNLLSEYKLTYSDQLIIIFEDLLQLTNITNSTLQAIHKFYQIENRNCHIQHRWCEMVIKFNYKNGRNDVINFLFDNQSMGVYLYGELVISGVVENVKIARDVYKQLENELDDNAKSVIKSMIFS